MELYKWFYIRPNCTKPNLYGGFSILITNPSGPSGGIQHSIPAVSRIIGGCRITPNIAQDNGIVFYDSATAQCSIIVQNTTGTLVFTQGSNGTILPCATASIGNLSSHYIEWDITFNKLNTAFYGGWKVWVDGVLTMFGTGITQQSANNTVNAIALVTYNTVIGATGWCSFDDLYVFDDTTEYNNSPLLADPIIITQVPVADIQTQFSNQGNVVGNYYPQLPPNIYFDLSGNSLYFFAIVPGVSCVLNSLVLNIGAGVASNPTANFQAIVYADNFGSPGSLLSGGTQVTGFLINTQVTLSLSSDISLSAGTQYWVGIFTDSAISLLEFAALATPGRSAPATYSSGPPATAPSDTTGQPAAYLFGLCTGASTDSLTVGVNPPLGDISSTASALGGSTDMFKFPPLPPGVTQVFTVGLSSNCAQSATSDIGVSLLTQTVYGVLGSSAELTVTPTYSWQDAVFDSEPGDPDGIWTALDVDNASFGFQIIAP